MVIDVAWYDMCMVHTVNREKALRKRMGVVGAKGSKRFRRWLRRSESAEAVRARAMVGLVPR